MKLEAMLEAVLAAPDDDEPRLVYADYLQEHGDPRGELIVVQCTRERLEREEKTTTVEYRNACWREQTLLSQLDGSYRRGFVDRVMLHASSTATELGALTDELVETVAIRGDGVIELDARVAMEIAPRLPKHEPLWVSERGLPHPLLVPAVVGVRYRLPTEQTIRDLMETEAPRLRSVTCVGSLQFTAGALQRYAATPSYARLDRLALWRVSEAEASFFIQHAPPKATDLTIAVEPDERPKFRMREAFRSCPALAHVRNLHLDVSPYEREDIERLHREASHLERWAVPAGIDDDALEAVLKGPLTKKLRHLELSFDGYPDAAKLVEAPWERLTSLAIGNAWIDAALANAALLEKLVTFRLFGCRLADDAEVAIWRRCPHVRYE